MPWASGLREVHFGSERPCDGAVPSAESEWLSSESLPGTVLDVLPGQRGELHVAEPRQLSESNLRGLREASPVGHVPRRGDRGRAGRAYWPDRLRPDAVLGFPTGVRLPFSPGPRGPGK